MKKAAKIFLVVVLVAGLPYVWWVHFNYRFATVVENKVYKSGAIPPEKIAYYINKHKIKTVVDLRDPGRHDALNTGKQAEIDREREVIEKLPGVRHINIPSGQVPSKETLTRFFEVMDDSAAYPVLIHCYHGTGRAMIYAALYRIEYEGFSNEEARAKTRVILSGSSFDQGRDKGDFLIQYKPRSDGENSTLNRMDSENTASLYRFDTLAKRFLSDDFSGWARSESNRHEVTLGSF